MELPALPRCPTRESVDEIPSPIALAVAALAQPLIPTVADGRVYLGMRHALYVYGLRYTTRKPR